MKQLQRITWLACVVWGCAVSGQGQPIVINEIMYHPASENTREEYIELFNRSATNVNLTGWRLSGGVDFAFPSNTTVNAGAFLVISAHRNTFLAKYPAVPSTRVVGDYAILRTTNLIGNVLTNWQNTLSNTRDTLNLRDTSDALIDTVTYADEGDWAVRQRGFLDSNRRGWIWNKPHDGDPVRRASLELVNPALPNEHGQNWKASTVAEGTPGAANSVASANLAPMLLNVMHQPAVPHSTDPVTISCRVLNEQASGLIVRLQWRIDAALPPPFTTNSMLDDGAHNDGVAGDGVYGWTIGPLPNNAVIEYFVSARDAEGNERTWPGPAIGAPDDGSGPTGQVVNALFQVDDDPLNTFEGNVSLQPVYKMVMTENERAELAAIPSTAANSDAQMNATFISLDAQGVQVRYLCGARNRGHGSRSANPPNYRINFRSDELWKDVNGLNLNSTRVHTQHFGSVLANKSGAVGGYSRAVQLRVNNLNRATSGSGGRAMFGSYAANEAENGDWAENHYPNNDGGNLYKVVRDIPPKEFNYRGLDPNAYRNTYFKQSNESEDDWMDLMTMLSVMGENSTTLFTMENIRQVVDLEQWLTHLAVMNLFANGESGLNTGNNDDYYMYRGPNDPRFVLIYHDLDSILGQSESRGATLSIFYPGCDNAPNASCPASGDTEGSWRAMYRLLTSPEIQPLYFQTFQRLLDTTFSEAEFNTLIDQTLGGYVTSSTIAAMKTWMNQRRASVQAQIGGPIVWNTNRPVAAVSGEPRSPTPSRNATLTIGGEGVTHYRFQLNGGPYSAETPVATTISLSNLPNGSTNVVTVIGRNANNVWQSTNTPSVSRTWIVNTAWPTVRINEILADNDAALNHEGTTPNLIELFNDGTLPVDLSGMRLTDDASSPNKFVFPVNTPLLPAGGYLVLFANEPDGTSGTHLGFTLDKDGEGVFLFNRVSAGGVLLDSVEFGMQLSDLSIGRVGNSGTWVLTQPTFGGANVVQAIGSPRTLRINEWLAAGQSPFAEDFLELYNSNSVPVALGGLYLTDKPVGHPQRHRIHDLSYAPANGFTFFIADGNGGSPDRLEFGLDSNQGEIALFAQDLSLIDCVSYGPQRIGVAEGRCPDGSWTNRFLAVPTPGGPNACPVPPIPPSPPVFVNLLPISATWRYLQSSLQSNNLDGVNWTAADYNDSSWFTGQAVLGVGGAVPEPVRTPLTTSSANITYYFRSTFTVPLNFNPTTLQFSNIIDDAAVFYINGREVARYNMPGGVITNRTPPLQGFGGPPPWTGPIAIGLTNLNPGLNTIAIEVHNADPFGDVFMGTRLDGVYVTNTVAPGTIVLNEIFANNATTADPDGSTPDWVELFNQTQQSVDLAGMSLADSSGNRWFFPVGSIVPGQGYFKVRFDADRPVSNTNTGFGLRAAGDIVTLYARSPNINTPLESRAFGLQIADFSIGRTPNGNTNWALNLPTIGSANIATSVGNVSLLKVNEWLADPLPGEDDWFEIYNPNAQPVDISHCYLGDNSTTHRLPALCFIGALSNAWQRFEANDQATPADQVPFRLGAGSDSIRLANSNAVPVDSVSWITQQQTDVSEGRLPDGASTIVRFPGTSSPGDANFVALTNVVINEVLAHTDPPREDAIELHNPTASPVSVAGWWLSDSRGVPQKFQIPLNTPAIPPGGFAVFYEYQFNNRDVAPIPFALSSSDGDQVYLSVANASGTMNGFRTFVDFGPSANGVSFGRHRTSVGFDFTTMSQHTFGADNPINLAQFRSGTGKTNVYPKVGPIVISEVMYHPPDVISQGITNDNLVEEFIELRNISASTFPLYDPSHPTNGWRLRDAVDFRFGSSHSIPPGGHLIVVSFDPAANASALAQFQNRYGTNFVLVGPYSGKLDNGGESVELLRPDTPQTNGSVPYIMADRVGYGDRAPWPTNADGFGPSLQRVSGTGYANDPTNWVAAAPAPGAFGVTDTDGDGMPDEWEQLYGFLVNNPNDADQDFDSDGMTNLEEYYAGTHPKQSGSVLELTATVVGGTTRLQFVAIAGRTYTILYSDSLSDETLWQPLAHVAPQGSTGTVTVPDNTVSPGEQRFYRIVTPGSL